VLQHLLTSFFTLILRKLAEDNTAGTNLSLQKQHNSLMISEVERLKLALPTNRVIDELPLSQRSLNLSVISLLNIRK